MRPTRFPTFRRLLSRLPDWLPRYERTRRRGWQIAPLWKIDTWAAQQRTLLRGLALASRERLPYGPLVAELAEDHQWSYRRRLGRLARRLEAGTPLADAVEQTPGVLSPEQTLAVRFGVESGTLPVVLSTLVEEGGEASAGVRNRLRQIGCYLAAVGVIATLVLAFLFFKILPEFRIILDEFAMDRPPVTEALLSFGSLVGAYWWLLLGAALVGAWVFFSEAGWRYFHRVWLPRVSRSAVRLRSAEVMRLLAITQQSGRPLAGAVSTLARYYYDARVRARLLFVRNEMEQGALAWQAMREAGLLAPAEARALEAAPDAASQAWTLRRLAGVSRQRIDGRLHLYAELLHPLAMLILAAGVLAVGVGALGPFFQLIRNLS